MLADLGLISRWDAPQAAATPADLRRHVRRVAGLAEVSREADATSTHRVVVAAEWSAAALPYAVLDAFVRMLPADRGVALVFAVPHSPSDVDRAAVASLVDSLPQTPQRLPPIFIESFAEAASRPVCAAVVPSGEIGALLLDFEQLLVCLHRLALWTPPNAEAPISADAERSLGERLREYRAIVDG